MDNLLSAMSSTTIMPEAMTWYYAREDQASGPLAAEELSRLAVEGSIRGDTLVWNESMPSWLPYGEVFAEAVRTCKVCQQVRLPSQVVIYGEAPICFKCKEAFFQRVREGLIPDVWHRYGGFWIRFAAEVIDLLVLFIVRLPLSIASRVLAFLFIYSSPESNPFLQPTYWIIEVGIVLLSFVVGAGYEIFFVGRFGGTPGKLALRLRVVRSDFSRVTYARAAGRFFARILSSFTLYIGYLMIAFDRERRGLHDYLCDTRVIRI